MEQQDVPDKQETQTEKKASNTGCLLVFLGFIIFAILGASLGWFDDESDKMDSNLRNGIYQTAKTAVKSELTRPSTADFSLWDAEFQQFSDKVYRISGTVKAKNGFGAEQEFRYKVTMTYWGGDPMSSSSWEVTGCSVTPK